MQVQTIARDVSVSGAAESRAFGIKDAARIFHLLVRNIYTRKEEAAIREIACNCLDAKGDRPFWVSVPSQTEPMMVFRDFGPGMTHDFMLNRYTLLNDSTKDETDEAVGGFGQGRLAVFAYTDSYTVTIYQGGRQRLYAVFVNERGLPQIDFIAEMETEEPDGTEVRFPVEPEHFHKFARTTQLLLQWFPEGSYELFGATPIAPRWKYKGEHFGILEEDQHVTRALMGPVRYDIDWTQIGLLRSSYDIGPTNPSTRIIPFFDIGAIDIQSSREVVEYTDKTKAAMKLKWEQIKAEIGRVAQEAARDMSPWEQMNYAKGLSFVGFNKFIADFGVNDRIKFTPSCIYTESRRCLGRQPNLHPGERVVMADSAFDRAYFVFDDLGDMPTNKKRIYSRLINNGCYHARIVYIFDRDPRPIFGRGAPGHCFKRLSEMEPEEVQRGSRSARELRIWRYRRSCGDFYQHTGPDEPGVYVPMNGTEVEDYGDREFLTSKWADGVTVWGLTKVARKQLDMSGWVHVRDYVEARRANALANPDVIKAHQARALIGALTGEAATLWSRLQARPSLIPEVKAVVDDMALSPPLDIKVPAADPHRLLPALRRALRKPIFKLVVAHTHNLLHHDEILACIR